jgi:hypothetical protein
MSKITKLDLYKPHAADYVTPEKPALVILKPAKYLAVTGQGAPGGAAFTTSIGALYGAAYTIKMARKAAGDDYVVCKLEAQWWTDAGPCGFAQAPRETWCWRLLIRTPDFVTKTDLRQAAQTLAARGKGEEVSRVVLETLKEGPCVQMLHVGPYEKEHETLQRMMDFAKAQDLTPHGLHHEIYLSDPRRVPPERLRTILRQPVKRAK